MTSTQLGQLIRKRRKSLEMNQADLALVSGTGIRFISDLENGKETCEMGKTLKVLENLGMNPMFKFRD
jgi:y4mF family transcriptional regulator